MRQQRGFTLIELLIVITVTGILILIGFPSIQNIINNSRIRALAHTLNAGLQRARSEAIRKNTNTEFVLFDLTATQATSIANTDFLAAHVSDVSACRYGPNWLIRTQAANELLDGQLNTQKSINCNQATESGLGYEIDTTGGASSIVFNSLGRSTLTTPVILAITNSAAGACAVAGGKIRCLNIIVSPGGQTRVCDPAVTTAQITAGDTRGCT